MKNKGGRSHTSTSLHKRGSLPWHLSVPCALFCHPPLHLKALRACFAGSLLQGGIALPALKGCRGTATLSTLISHCCLKCCGCLVVCGGGGRYHLSFFLCVAPGTQALTRPGHVSTAVMQTISSANCKVSGSRGTCWIWMAGQRKALFCDKEYVETSSLFWVQSAQLFCSGDSFSLILCGLLALLTCALGGANSF